MKSTFVLKFITLFTIFSMANLSYGQLAGARGGVAVRNVATALRSLSLSEVEGFITVQGSAEIRIDPTRIRMVLAIISEDEKSIGCREEIKAVIDEIKKGWAEIGIKEADIDEDFIAILPVYEWKVNGNVATEYKAKYRMQTNLNVAVSDEAKAKAAMDVAFRAGVTDVIGFDYWSKEIEEQKAAALAKAIAAAQKKANTMLAVFDEKPKAINIAEDTKTIYPVDLYESFQNTYNSSAQRPSRRDLTFISAYRPKNTYYKGLQAEVDSGHGELAMKRQISIVSTVRIYYRSPGADMGKDEGNDKD